MDKPMRTKVADYIDKTIEESKKDGDEEFASNGNGTASANGQVCESHSFNEHCSDVVLLEISYT